MAKCLIIILKVIAFQKFNKFITFYVMNLWKISRFYNKFIRKICKEWHFSKILSFSYCTNVFDILRLVFGIIVVLLIQILSLIHYCLANIILSKYRISFFILSFCEFACLSLSQCDLMLLIIQLRISVVDLMTWIQLKFLIYINFSSFDKEEYSAFTCVFYWIY